MNNPYDVGIIGGGPAAIFAAYELMQHKPDIRIVMVETGNDIYSRKCPIAEGKVASCIHCKSCDIMRGFGGAGAFSDGKYNFTTQFGGWLQDYLSDKELVALIDYVDEINLGFGAPSESYSTHNSGLSRLALSSDLHLLHARVRHLGTENNLKILEQLYEYLKTKITMRFNAPVTAIHCQRDSFQLEIAKGASTVECDYLIAAPGRAGSEWFAKQCTLLGLALHNNQVDVGVRVEIPAEIFDNLENQNKLIKAFIAKYLVNKRHTKVAVWAKTGRIRIVGSLFEWKCGQ